jgi:hypothetical protein
LRCTAEPRNEWDRKINHARGSTREHSDYSAALALVLLAATVLAACANPRRPSGGPRDETPPAIASSEPPTGATSVSPEEIRITFSEYVEPSSFAEAFSLTPALPNGRPEFDWSGRTVTVSLPPEALRDSTTYIATLGTGLRDVRGVSLDAPITLAFATGPKLNKGRLAGRVVGADRGQPRAKVNVFAYAAPDSSRLDSLPSRPAYRTQAGSNGRFTFKYLREQPYFVVALSDRNANQQIDPGEPFAAPPRPLIFADTLKQQRDTLRWIMTRRDERPPVAQRVRVQSRRRFGVSFNEAVLLTSRAPDAWPLTDSLPAASETVRQVYMRSQAPRRVFLTTTDTMRSRPHWIAPGGAADSSGQPARPDTLRFDPSGAPPDTAQLRFGGFLPERRTGGRGPLVLGPRQHIRLRFNLPPPDSLPSFVTITASAGTDTTRADTARTSATGRPRSFFAQTSNGTVYRLRPDPPLSPDSALTVRVTLPSRPDTTYRRRYKRLSEREVGGVLGTVRAPDTSRGAPVVGLTPGRETKYAKPRVSSVEAGKQFALRELPAGSYRVRIFWDQDEDGAWDGGQLIPYTPPEPIRWLAEPVDVRARWDTELDTLRLSNGE